MARILVIDDDDQVRKMFLKMFQQVGHETMEAGNGKEGLACYRKEKPDVVVTDLIMPEMEGIETIKELKREFPEANIIAISGGGNYVSAELALEMAGAIGAKHVFVKPVERKVLLQAIDELCG